jgi:hypothetical protein
MIEQIKLAAKLYEARDSARFIHGDNFPAKVAEFRPHIEKVMKAKNLDTLKATMDLVKTLQDLDAPGALQLIILATGVEMIEPTLT